MLFWSSALPLSAYGITVDTYNIECTSTYVVVRIIARLPQPPRSYPLPELWRERAAWGRKKKKSQCAAHQRESGKSNLYRSTLIKQSCTSKAGGTTRTLDSGDQQAVSQRNQADPVFLPPPPPAPGRP